MTKKTNKKEYVAEELQQRIDFTDWLSKNPKMRPKRKKGDYRGKKTSPKRKGIK